VRTILAMAGLQLRLAVRNRANLAVGLILPLMLTGVFGLITTAGQGTSQPVYPVAAWDEDGSLASAVLARALGEAEGLRVRSAAGPEELRRWLADRRVTVGVILPRGYGRALDQGAEPPPIQVLTQPGDGVGVALGYRVREVAARSARDYRLALAHLRRSGTAPEPEAVAAALDRVQAARAEAGAGVRVEPVAAPPARGTGFTLGEQALGFTVSFVMMLVFQLGGVVLRERQQGTWARLRMAPAGPLQLLLGYLAGFFVTGWVQFGILVGASRLLFGLGWGDPLQLAAVASAYILCSVGLGLLFAGLVRTPEQQQAAGIFLVVATSMLGGAYWPLDLVGETMRRIGYLTPQAWAMEGFRTVLLRGGGWADLSLPLAVLGGMAALFLAAGVLRLRAEG